MSVTLENSCCQRLKFMYLQLDLLFVNRDIVQHSLFIASHRNKFFFKKPLKPIEWRVKYLSPEERVIKWAQCNIMACGHHWRFDKCLISEWLTICMASWKISATVLILWPESCPQTGTATPLTTWIQSVLIDVNVCNTFPVCNWVQRLTQTGRQTLLFTFICEHFLTDWFVWTSHAVYNHFADIRAAFVTKGARFPLSWYAAGTTGVQSIGPVTDCWHVEAEDRPEGWEAQL